MSLAPITYFAFNRPEHTGRTLAALAANPEAIRSELHVFVDGPRNEDEHALVDEVLRVIHAANGFGKKTVVASTTNQGLYRAITRGVSDVLKNAGRTIVVEDDILVSPFFLSYMNEALSRYESDPRVGSIHAYSPPIEGLPNFFFLRGADCWGWATWKDRWELFDTDAPGLLRTLVSRGLITEFCASHGSQSLLYLARRARNRNASWAIMWHASLFLADRFTLHPGKSFVQNIGNDGSGIHSVASSAHQTELLTTFACLPALPVKENHDAARALSAFLDATDGGGHYKVIRVLKRGYAMLAARFPKLLP